MGWDHGWDVVSHLIPDHWSLGSGALTGLRSHSFTPGGCCGCCAVAWHMAMLLAMAPAGLPPPWPCPGGAAPQPAWSSLSASLAATIKQAHLRGFGPNKKPQTTLSCLLGLAWMGGGGGEKAARDAMGSYSTPPNHGWRRFLNLERKDQLCKIHMKRTKNQKQPNQEEEEGGEKFPSGAGE